MFFFFFHFCYFTRPFDNIRRDRHLFNTQNDDIPRKNGLFTLFPRAHQSLCYSFVNSVYEMSASLRKKIYKSVRIFRQTPAEIFRDWSTSLYTISSYTLSGACHRQYINRYIRRQCYYYYIRPPVACTQTYKINTHTTHIF